MQYSETLRNNQLAQIETTAGTTPVLKMFAGSAPANCAASDTGTLIATFTLPSDWMATPSAGSVSKLGTWQVSATDSGTLSHFRLYNSGATVCHVQGTISMTAGDMIVDNTNVQVSQTITVSTFTISAGNA